MTDDLMANLNKEQLEAVMHDQGPLLIVAGAGTGKTTVITQRIAYLIEQGKAKADEILALTFTEKAAGEMEERVDRLLPMGYVDLWISTFHSFGEHLLRDHGLEIGLPAGARLLNEFEQYALVKENFAKFDLDYYRPLGNPTKFIRALINHFSRLKDENISPADYLSYAEELQENLDSMLSGSKKISSTKFKSLISGIQTEDKEIVASEVNRINEIANAYHVYQQLLLDNSTIDFGDLINYLLKLFRERPKILDLYRRQFKYILLDEFQDTNWAQYELIKLLAAPKNNLVVVGDDDQSIYKFRGASVANIMQFNKDYSKAKQVVLIKNYRNKQNILDLAYNFIQFNNPDRLEVQLKRKGGEKKISKKLQAHTKGRGLIELISAKDLPEEMRLVAERIAELKIADKQCSWGDFAILVRANNSAKEVCAVLEAAVLPYQYLASRGLYAKPVILDIVAYFKLLDNYHESSALYRVLNMPIFNFSYSELVNFNYVAQKKTLSLYTVLKTAKQKFGIKTQAKIDKVMKLIAEHTILARDKQALEVMLAFLNDSGYLKSIIGQGEERSRELLGYLNQFRKRIEKFLTGSRDKSIKSFLSELNMEIDSGEEGTLAPDIEAGPDTIKVMTMHGAKGLEFKYVFIVNMVDKRFPTTRRHDPIAVPDDLIKEILPEGDAHLAEERRLFYVALTRAKSGIFLSWASDYGGLRKKKPSRFLVESGLLKLGSEEQRTIKTGQAGQLQAFSPSAKKELVQKKQDYKPPIFFSYTQLAAFSNCPYQYRFAHILRVPRLGKPVFSFGKTMHSVMQKIFEIVRERSSYGQTGLFANLTAKESKVKSEIITLDEIYKLFEESWIDEWYESAARKKEYKNTGKKILKEFYAKHKDNWPVSLFLEKGFNLKVAVNKKLYSIRGVIDRIDKIGDKIKIIDYKTGSPKSRLSFGEKEQLFIYQLAAREIFDQEVGALSFYYLENNTEVEFIGTDSELEKVNKKIIKTIQDIHQGEFLPKPSILCRYCDFKEICEFRRL